jgi:pimeloyl-ACP methyl ester carboxylesterase
VSVIETAAKPVLYLLPGLMCDAGVWQEQQAALGDEYEVRVPLFRGFDSLRAMAEAVLREAPERFSVAGHSMGGRVAFELMELAGKRIERFAVLDTGVHPVSPDEPAKRQLLLDLARRKGLQAVAEAWILPMLHPANHGNKSLIAAITAMILRNSVADYQGQVKALLTRADQTPYLRHITQRTWLIVGESDNWSPVAQHQAMAALIPRSELRVVKDAGHMCMMERPEAVTGLLKEWLHAGSR